MLPSSVRRPSFSFSQSRELYPFNLSSELIEIDVSRRGIPDTWNIVGTLRAYIKEGLKTIYLGQPKVIEFGRTRIEIDKLGHEGNYKVELDLVRWVRSAFTTFYELETEPVTNIDTILPRTATIRLLNLQRNVPKTIDFATVPGLEFENFEISFVLVDVENFGDNDRLDVDIFYLGQPVQSFRFNEPSPVLPQFILDKNYSLEITANRDDVDAVKFTITEAADHTLIILP